MSDVFLKGTGCFIYAVILGCAALSIAAGITLGWVLWG